MIVLLSFALLCVLSATLAWIDIRHGIIPDWLNLAIAGLGLCQGDLLCKDGPARQQQDRSNSYRQHSHGAPRAAFGGCMGTTPEPADKLLLFRPSILSPSGLK